MKSAKGAEKLINLLGSLVDVVRLVSDAGMRYILEKSIAGPQVLQAKLQEEVEQCWTDLEREVAQIVRSRSAAQGLAAGEDATPISTGGGPSGSSESHALPISTFSQTGFAAPTDGRGWGPMP
jgi:hypothetical protein